jgi:superkiller protein 3
MDYFEGVIEKKPDYAEAYFNLGYIYARKADYDKAIELYEQATSLKKNYGDAYYNLGNAYNMKQMEQKKISAYKKAARNDSFLAKQWLKKNKMTW